MTSYRFNSDADPGGAQGARAPPPFGGPIFVCFLILKKEEKKEVVPQTRYDYKPEVKFIRIYDIL